eukprot:2864389-Prorocentrum_lima.AAC.1
MDGSALERGRSLEEKRPKSAGARPNTLAPLEAPAPQEAQREARGGHFGRASTRCTCLLYTSPSPRDSTSS